MQEIRAAVIGDPIKHSLSPKIHGFLLEQYNIKGTYIPIQVRKEELRQCIQHLIENNFAGFNVTLPHKEEIFKICDFRSKTAQLTGAVNTVIITEDKKLFGHNSDAEGFLNNLIKSQPDFDLRNKNAFVIGAGGAARALVYSLIKAGAQKVVITNRNEIRAAELIKNFRDFAKSKNCDLQFMEMADFEKNLDCCDLLTNSTSLGMQGQEELKIDLSNLKKSAIVYDIVYKPLMTDLLKDAEKRGNKITTGIGMLIEQALIGFEAWFKQKPQAIDVQKLYETILQQD